MEHVGSTSVPGCAGKGVVDLMVVYQEGRLSAARDLLAIFGFERQRGREPWPEERPMRVGSIVHDGTRFALHVHVIAASSPEVNAMLAFRDGLRSNAELLAAYVACKRAIIADGCTDSLDYSHRKHDFISRAVEAVSERS